MVKTTPANAGDTGSVSAPGRFHMLQSNEARAPPTAEASVLKATAVRSPQTAERD